MPCHPLASALVVPTATAAAAWWLVGDLSAAGPDLAYQYDLPDLPPAVTAGAGVAGLAAAMIVGRPLVRDRTTRRPTLALAVVGVVVAYGARVTTAGVHGANIGAGMVLLAAPVVVRIATPAVLRLHRATRRIIPERPWPPSPPSHSGRPAPSR